MCSDCIAVWHYTVAYSTYYSLKCLHQNVTTVLKVMAYDEYTTGSQGLRKLHFQYP